MQTTSMEINYPDLDAFESVTRAQLRAREIGKIGALIPNLLQIAPVPEAMGKSSHENSRESQCGTSSHKQSDLDKSPEDLDSSTEWIFQGYLFFCSDGWRTDEAYEAEDLCLDKIRFLVMAHRKQPTLCNQHLMEWTRKARKAQASQKLVYTPRTGGTGQLWPKYFIQ